MWELVVLLTHLNSGPGPVEVTEAEVIPVCPGPLYQVEKDYALLSDSPVWLVW